MSYDAANDEIILVDGVALASDSVMLAETTLAAVLSPSIEITNSTTSNSLELLSLDSSASVQVATSGAGAAIQPLSFDINPLTTTNNFDLLSLDSNASVQVAATGMIGITGSAPTVTSANVTNNFVFVVLDSGSFPTPTETTTTTVTTSSRVQYWG